MPVYSYSRLSAFENCPLQFKLSYIDRVEVEWEDTVEAFMGSRVHETLENLYRELMLSKHSSLDDLLGFYRDKWDREWNDNIKIVREEYTQENYRDTGETCIGTYYNRYDPFNQTITIDLEKRLMIDLDGYKFMGFIDRLAKKEDGCYEIHDYKASQHLPSKEQFENDRQLTLYQIGVQQLWDDVENIDLVWHYLIHDQEIRINRTPDDLEKAKQQLIQTIQQIETAQEEDDFPPKEGALCSWCAYHEYCPKFKHIARTEQMPLNEFLGEPGVNLVNEYAAMKQKSREIDGKLEELKEALIEYAKMEDVEVIRGSDIKARVGVQVRTAYPRNNEEGRTEIEELVKSAGKWEDVSRFDVAKLAKAVKEKWWDEKLIEALMEYEREEEEYRIYLSKLRDDEE